MVSCSSPRTSNRTRIQDHDNDHEEEEELVQAARAGILLLEKNQELTAENQALRMQLKLVEFEKISIQEDLAQQRQLLQVCSEERKQSLQETNALRLEVGRNAAAIKKLIEANENLFASNKNLRNELQDAQAKCINLEQNLTESLKSSADTLSHSPPLSEISDEGRHDLELNLKHIQTLQNELTSAQKDLDSLRIQLCSIPQLQTRINELEHALSDFRSQKKDLDEELTECKCLIESQQSMMQMYKQIADSRPISTEPTNCMKPLSSELFAANAQLEKELQSLRSQIEFQDQNSDFVSDNVQELHTKLQAKDELVKRVKEQWMSAIASKKDLEQCNAIAQVEIARLTKLLQHGRTHFMQKCTPVEKDEFVWVEEPAMYPAPPSDLNSPLIKCLLDHYTTDKSKLSQLSIWLQHAIRGTGKILRLKKLAPEVTAGFIKLLVPILRERHGVAVRVHRRDSVQIISDLMLDSSDGKVDSVVDDSAPSLDAVDPVMQTDYSVRGVVSRFLKGEAHFLYG